MRVCVRRLGPLLFHFADMPNESSIEVGYDELRKVILSLNFEILVSHLLTSSLLIIIIIISGIIMLLYICGTK